MRKFLALIVLIAAAMPAAADWRQTASTRTWFLVRPTARATEFRDAFLWHYQRTAFNGAVQLAALANIAMTDVGGGNSEVAITMPRAAADNWLAAFTPTICSQTATVADRLACADAAMRADALAIWNAYKAHLHDLAKPADES